MAFCFLKYRNTCKSETKKHPKTEIVPLSRVVKFDIEKIKTRSFKVKCGKQFFEAVIAFVANSEEEIERLLKQSRAKFTPESLLRSSTSGLVAPSNNSQKQQCSQKDTSHVVADKSTLLRKKLKEMQVPSNPQNNKAITAENDKEERQSGKVLSKPQIKTEEILNRKLPLISSKPVDDVDGSKIQGPVEKLLNNVRSEQQSSEANSVPFHVHKKVVEENFELKRRILHQADGLRKLRAQNLTLVNKVINGFEKVTVANMDETSSFNIQSKIQNGELLPPGFEDMKKLDEMKVHIALGQWMDKIQYDTIKRRANNVPKRFIGKALNLFTEEVLKKSSITGKAGNAHKSRKMKPALDATKLNAVYAHFEWWMRSKVHLSEDQISHHLKNANNYIGKKIAELNRGPREYKRKKDSEGKKKSAEKFKSVEKIEEDNYKSHEDSQISPPGPSVDLMDPEENEEHIGTPSESLEEKEDDFEKKERTERESPERREDQELIID